LKNLLKLESKGSTIIAMTRDKNVKAEFLFTNTTRVGERKEKRKIARAIRATRLILRDMDRKFKEKSPTDFSP